MRRNVCVLFTLFLLSFTYITQAQPGSISHSQLDHYMQQVRMGTYQPIPSQLWQDQQQAEALLQALQTYQQDTLAAVRAKVDELTQKIALNSQQPTIRQQAVQALLQACQDRDAGNSGLASRYLTAFSPADFDQSAKVQLNILLQIQPPHYPTILRLAGYVQLQQAIPLIRQKIASGEISRQVQWAAYLALARMGEEDAVQYCISKISRYPVNDEVVYALLPELLYIRQPQAIDYLVNIIFSDEPSCASADPEAGEYILCGYRVMELLAPVIKDFPVSLSASGDLAVEDYQAALLQVRDWFRAKGDQYVIVKDTF